MSDSAPKPRIIVTEKISEGAMQRLAAGADVSVINGRDPAALLEAARTADGLVVRTYSLVTAEVLAAAKAAGRLKIIGRGGVGVDNIDIQAAAAAGITVVNTPAASTHAVADLVVGMIIAVQRRVAANDPLVRAGQWSNLRSAPVTRELRHQTIGIIGMGRIGTAVGFRMHNGFGARIIYRDIREIGWLPFPAQAMDSSEAVYAEADVVTFHVPLTPLTRGMANAAALARFKPGSVLINASRGPVVVGADLAAALRDGPLGGAAIDVFEVEPPPADHPLMSAPNCLLSPHMGARSVEGLAAMDEVVDDVLGVLAGREPIWPVQPEAG